MQTEKDTSMNLLIKDESAISADEKELCVRDSCGSEKEDDFAHSDDVPDELTYVSNLKQLKRPQN